MDRIGAPLTSPKARCLRLQFSLRTLLASVLLLSVLLGWVSSRLKQASLQRDAASRIRQVGGTVWYAYQRDDLGHFIRKDEATIYHPWRATTARLLGDDLAAGVTGVDLSGRAITDKDLASLASLQQLEWLFLQDTRVTDAGLVHLRGLTQLGILHLENTQVTDAGVTELKTRLPNLGILR
jgi:hypothetical protein